MSIEKMREEFEAAYVEWLVSQGWDKRSAILTLERSEDDEYYALSAKGAWFGWQASRAAMEGEPVCPTCPTCYGRGWDMDCQNEFRPATCPDCAGSGKAEHSITVQESDSAAPDVTALVEALQNMLGAFDNPIIRRKVGSVFSEEAIGSAHAALDAHRSRGGE